MSLSQAGFGFCRHLWLPPHTARENRQSRRPQPSSAHRLSTSRGRGGPRPSPSSPCTPYRTRLFQGRACCSLPLPQAILALLAALRPGVDTSQRGAWRKLVSEDRWLRTAAVQPARRNCTCCRQPYVCESTWLARPVPRRHPQ